LKFRLLMGLSFAKGKFTQPVPRFRLCVSFGKVREPPGRSSCLTLSWARGAASGAVLASRSGSGRLALPAEPRHPLPAARGL